MKTMHNRKQWTQVIFPLLLWYIGDEIISANEILPCNTTRFNIYVNDYCIKQFSKSMAYFNYNGTCSWPKPIVLYQNLTDCVNIVAKYTSCFDPLLAEKILIRLHEEFFSMCPNSPNHIADPSLYVMLFLALPCIVCTLLMPCLCTAIVLRTANQEQSINLQKFCCGRTGSQ
ncbi:receptor activity-modifying protein 1-like [Protopterus annectens]|uniref:receptor activity-modifying protein 1-like n=1 Tax=Protopterus annectens TaxID=7888 RepID=UPI001CF9890B|nr:receptor activity-modifying protein 1-like [Protopterus annectens]